MIPNPNIQRVLWKRLFLLNKASCKWIFNFFMSFIKVGLIVKNNIWWALSKRKKKSDVRIELFINDKLLNSSTCIFCNRSYFNSSRLMDEWEFNIIEIR
jgi:hypothetical protein